MKRQTVEELVQIIDTEVTRELFRHIGLNQDVLHHRNSSQFGTLFEENRLIDGTEVLEKINS